MLTFHKLEYDNDLTGFAPLSKVEVEANLADFGQF